MSQDVETNSSSEFSDSSENNDRQNTSNNNNISEGHSEYPVIKIARRLVHQKDLYIDYKDVDLELKDDAVSSECFGIRNIRRDCECTPVKWIRSCIPVFEWLPKYQWKEDLKNDIVAGLTISIMHIPQGMAYALLANLPPIVGIYMAFFPVIIYTLLGTSRHASIGTFAVVCLMTGKLATDVFDKYHPSENISNAPYASINLLTSEGEGDKKKNYDILQIATAISLTVGLCQILMGVLRLGRISLLLSPALVGGFTTGSAVHVFTSQVKSLFGIAIKGRQGFFLVPMSYVDIVRHIGDSNTTAIIISAVTISVLVFYNEVLKAYLSRKIPFPIPVELCIIVCGTIVSHYGKMAATYDVSIIGDIPTGFPEPSLPPLDVIPDVLVGSIIISFIAYAILISLAKIFANKHNYSIDANQELIALGSSSIVGSFFKCAPVSASLARSSVQESAGGRTQLTGIVSCGILIFILLWLGPYFEDLPHCVLSAIIVVALKSMLFQVFELPRIWRECSIHGMIWTISFLATVVLDIEYGLGAGMFVSLLHLIWRSNKAHISVLGKYEDCDLFVDLKACTLAKEIPEIKIIKYSGSLNFATIEFFLGSVDSIINSVDICEDRLVKGESDSSIFTVETTISDLESRKESLEKISGERPIKWAIFDLSSAGSVDAGAVNSLKILHTVYKKKGIQFIYANCSFVMFQFMFKCKFVQHAGTNSFFPTVHDAVAYCNFQETATSNHQNY